MSSRPTALLGLALALALVANACGSEDVAVRCGPGTVERNAQCAAAGGGRSGAAASAGGHGAASAGENAGGGGRSSAGQSSAHAGQSAHAGRALERRSAHGRHRWFVRLVATEEAAHAGDGVSGDDGAAGVGAAGAGAPQGGASVGGQASSFGGADDGGAPDLGESLTVCTTEPIHCANGDAPCRAGVRALHDPRGGHTARASSDTTVLNR